MHTVTIIALKAIPQQLEAHYSAVAAEFKHWAPPSWDGIPNEPLTAVEQICRFATFGMSKSTGITCGFSVR
jgi:hypothetical protein